jgi:hypothetical protein
MLPARQDFDKDFFAGPLLPSIIDDRAPNRTKLKASGTLLHLDSAQTHLTSDKYDKIRIKRLPHPPYSQDLASCGFWIFEYLEHCLEGRFFGDDIALEGAVSKTVLSIEPDRFVRVFAAWKRRLQQYIDQRGDYL